MITWSMKEKKAANDSNRSLSEFLFVFSPRVVQTVNSKTFDERWRKSGALDQIFSSYQAHPIVISLFAFLSACFGCSLGFASVRLTFRFFVGMFCSESIAEDCWGWRN